MLTVKTLILSPGKAATTFLASKIDGARVIHSWRKNYYKASTPLERKLWFFVNSIIRQLRIFAFPHVVLLPWRPDRDSRNSFFWNNFEKNLYNYTTKYKKRFRSTRYLTQEEFLRDVYEHTEFTTYEDWLQAHFFLAKARVPGNLPTDGLLLSKFGRSDMIYVDIRRLEMLKNIPMFTQIDFTGEGNIGSEFWHYGLRSVLEKYTLAESEEVEEVNCDEIN